MKPLKLTLQAFGPFAGTEIVDFESLGQSPLFLINGPTGAGKSSILDAMCFALYGQTTSKEREASAMRCDFADDKLTTLIEFEFSLGNKVYRITRTPAQRIAKKRGEGTTEKAPEASVVLIEDNKETLLVSKKTSEANALIDDLTGLNVEQFRQVMVLPQGKFRDFLMADSKEREEIFSKLFQTEAYKRIEFKLREQASDIQKSVNDLKQQKSGLLQSVDIENEEALGQSIKASHEALEKSTQQKEAAGKEREQHQRAFDIAAALQKQFDQQATLKKSLIELSDKDALIEQQKSKLATAMKAEKLRPLHQEFNQASARLEKEEDNLKSLQEKQQQAEAQKANAEKSFAQAQQQEPELQQLQIKFNEFAPLANKIRQLEQDVQQHNQLKEQNRHAIQQLEAVQQSLEAQKQQNTAKQQRYDAIKVDVEQLSKAQTAVETIKNRGKERAALDESLKSLRLLETRHEQQMAATRQQQQNLERLELSDKQLQLQWHTNQAAILAAQLTHDAPCPVCGSYQHPAPAQPSHGQEINQEMLQQSQQQLSNCRAQWQNLAAEQAATEGQLNQSRQQIEQQRLALGTVADLSTDTLREQYQNAKQKLRQLESQATEKKTLEDQIREHHTQIEQLTQSWQQTNAHAQKAQQDLAVMSEKIQQLQATIPPELGSQTALNAAIEQTQQRIQQIQQTLKDAQSRLDHCNQEKARYQANVEQSQANRHQLQTELDTASKSWADARNANNFESDALFADALLDEQQQKALDTQIRGHEEQKVSLKAALETLEAQLQDAEAPDIDALKTQLTASEQAYQHALAAWSAANEQLTSQQNVHKQLEKLAEKDQQLNQEYAVIGTLAEVANGNNAQRLSLQRFVLSVLLDDVLIEASQRLHIMSKGRYQLFRKEDRAKGNKASGLELEVEDAYTGKTRSVATLSGGESFMAALSLALGLSDVVQAYAGGIRLDTLFIDEGFGSLDQESLDLAIQTLVDLQASGRMIGIISHVSELKEQMALRVDVNASAAGSTIVVRC